MQQNGNRMVVTTTACQDPPLNPALGVGPAEGPRSGSGGDSPQGAMSGGGCPPRQFKGRGGLHGTIGGGVPVEGMPRGTI